MSMEFVNQLSESLAKSPSPSEADNCLAQKLLQQLSENDSKSDSGDLAKRCLLAWQSKKLPRYLIDQGGNIVPDALSGRLWSPSFYRIDASLSVLKSKLTDKKILDPFAGSGSMIYTLMCFDIPYSIVLNDICYQGGQPIHQDEAGSYYYSPTSNLNEYKALFNTYSGYITPPKFDQNIDYNNQDIRNGLPYDSKSFDYVFTDPPYGRSLKESGIDNFLQCIPEMMRVSQNGILSIIPEDWLPLLDDQKSYKIENLTGTLAHAKTTFKTVLAHIH